MSKRSENMASLGATYHPRELLEQMEEARKPGETKTDFLRASIVREIKRRGGKATMPNVQMGRPREIYPDDWPRCSCGEPCMDGKDTCGNVECG